MEVHDDRHRFRRADRSYIFYPTALEFDIFSNNLVFEIEQARKDPKAIHLAHLKSREETERLVDDFCFNNAEAFALKNFPTEE